MSVPTTMVKSLFAPAHKDLLPLSTHSAGLTQEENDMKIIDPEMAAKMNRALKLGNDVYTLDDIDRALASGDMQSHVIGNTLAITQIYNWPQKRSVNILFVVG